MLQPIDILNFMRLRLRKQGNLLADAIEKIIDDKNGYGVEIYVMKDFGIQNFPSEKNEN